MESSKTPWLLQRQGLNEALVQDPYSVKLYKTRAEVYGSMGYPDLAIADAYKALLLVDEITDEGGEYHESAYSSARDFVCGLIIDERIQACRANPQIQDRLERMGLEESTSPPVVEEDEVHFWAYSIWTEQLCLYLALKLAVTGCLRSACTYLKRVEEINASDQTLKEVREMINDKIEKLHDVAAFDWKDSNIAKLPDDGYVRREIYAWNKHEEDRMSQEALGSLNDELSRVAPKLCVKVTELPLLNKKKLTKECGKTMKQLGVFAKCDILPGEIILREKSLLTANARLHEPLCDACSTRLPSLDEISQYENDKNNREPEEGKKLLPCPECEDTVFCSEDCLREAQDLYHPAVCGLDADDILKDVPPSKAADSLYLLLLFRALALAQTSQIHPLDLKEVKYIWGDFEKPLDSGDEGDSLFLSSPETLPFSFSDNVLTPMHILERMDIPLFTAPNEINELWVWNTLLAKFRGTASARISARDGRPEVAAVHPLWCLANHSCDPNVQWEWAGDIKFTSRESHIPWQKKKEDGSLISKEPERSGGIGKGDEILNHYVDIELPVEERREWGRGALGGPCMCPRCVWESE